MLAKDCSLPVDVSPMEQHLWIFIGGFQRKAAEVASKSIDFRILNCVERFAILTQHVHPKY